MASVHREDTFLRTQLHPAVLRGESLRLIVPQSQTSLTLLTLMTRLTTNGLIRLDPCQLKKLDRLTIVLLAMPTRIHPVPVPLTRSRWTMAFPYSRPQMKSSLLIGRNLWRVFFRSWLSFSLHSRRARHVAEIGDTKKSPPQR